MSIFELQKLIDSIDDKLLEAENKLHEKYWYWKHSEELKEEEKTPLEEI